MRIIHANYLVEHSNNLFIIFILCTLKNVTSLINYKYMLVREIVP